MQIINLKISNIESFGFVPNLNQIEGTNFINKENGTTNIIIGPNGAGKSSILEILNQIIKIGIQQDYIYNKNIKLDERGKFPIQKIQHSFHHLAKNFLFPEKTSSFFIKILLTHQDIKNINFVSKNYEKINLYIKKYSGLDLKFEPVDLSLLELNNTFSLFGSFDFLSKKIVIRTSKFSKLKLFVLNYLRHHELLKIIFHIISKEESGNNFPILGNQFAILGAKRDFDRQLTYKDNFSDEELDIKTYKTNTKTVLYGGLGYLLVAKKLRKLIREFGFKNMLESKFFKDLNSIFEKYLNLTLFVKYSQGKVFLYCQKDANKTFFSFNQLSSGEESFSLLILTMFGYELYNGTMLIDEPELHLHPQSQQNFVKLLNELQKKFHTQFIVATHSPIFVSPETIQNTIRLSKKNGQTIIYNCKQHISSEEHNLMHMLKYGNVAKIFFVDKILMVEGETDLYFFSHYLDYLKNINKRENVIKNYEIIDIGGKGSFKKWSKLLLKFGIESFFIGDWDNVLDSNTDSHIYGYKKKLQSKDPRFRKYHTFYKTQTYGKLILYLQDFEPKTYRRLIKKIDNFYDQNFFLLKKGDLETYIGLKKKGLGPTVDFCNKDFIKRVDSEFFKDHRTELEKIILKIFEK